jgi:hypothetical protein
MKRLLLAICLAAPLVTRAQVGETFEHFNSLTEKFLRLHENNEVDRAGADHVYFTDDNSIRVAVWLDGKIIHKIEYDFDLMANGSDDDIVRIIGALNRGAKATRESSGHYESLTFSTEGGSSGRHSIPSDEEATAAFNFLQDRLGKPHVKSVSYDSRTDSYIWIGPASGKRVSMPRSQFEAEIWPEYIKAHPAENTSE